MSDYISKNAIVDRLSDEAVNAKVKEESSCANACTYYAGIKSGFWEAAIIVDNFPTVDAVPVVRCKDCKYYRADEKLPPQKFCFRLKDRNGEAIGYNFAEDDFCSYGERSEAELKNICPLRECNNCKEICPTTYSWCEERSEE